jgi:hypothetical protein
MLFLFLAPFSRRINFSPTIFPLFSAADYVRADPGTEMSRGLFRGNFLSIERKRAAMTALTSTTNFCACEVSREKGKFPATRNTSEGERKSGNNKTKKERNSRNWCQ